ncbi:MAG: sulfotransferase domain-containing protein [Acidobacteriota bacterium]
MQRLNYSLSLPNGKSSQNLYGILQQELDFGVQALKSGRGDVAVTFFQSALQKLMVEQPFYDHLVHNLLLSYKLLIEQLFENGDAASANNFLQAALNLEICGEMAEDSHFRKRFAGAFQDLGLVFFKHKHFEASVLCCRKAISIYPSPSSHVNLTNALAASGQRAELADFTTDIIREQLGTHIFIACVPKSASTFLKNLLVSLTGYRDVFMVYAANQNEHELYLPTLREAAHLDTVTQQHCRASDANVQMMQAFDIKPVVLVRNVFDSVMSQLDFYNNGAFNNSYFRADYQSLDEETKIDLLIDNVIPWYFQFVASWSLVEKKKSLEIFWLSYEDLISDKPAAIQSVLRFYGLGAARRGIEQKVRETESEKRKTRFNKGVKGRGKSGLSEQQKERIRRLAKYYPTTDFSRIGL